MSGKRRLSATGKWLLDSSGKVKICTCCDGGCFCNGYCYIVNVTAVDLPGCSCVTLAAAVLADIQEDYGPIPLTAADCNLIGGIYDGTFDCDIVWVYETTWDWGGCPADGEYSFPITLTDAEDPATICTGTITVDLARINCCAEIDPATYYLSCDIVYTRHEDAGGNITDCQGTGGTETCNTTASMTDEPIVSDVIACVFLSENTFTCYCPTSLVPPDPNYVDSVLVALESGVWNVYFGTGGTALEQFTSKVGGLTPVGTYPDITFCYFDGFNAYDLSITNIVITA